MHLATEILSKKQSYILYVLLYNRSNIRKYIADAVPMNRNHGSHTANAAYGVRFDLHAAVVAVMVDKVSCRSKKRRVAATC